jgi:hypothetical protein
MDEKQQKQVNEAAEKLADALKESYQSYYRGNLDEAQRRANR